MVQGLRVEAIFEKREVVIKKSAAYEWADDALSQRSRSNTALRSRAVRGRDPAQLEARFQRPG